MALILVLSEVCWELNDTECVNMALWLLCEQKGREVHFVIVMYHSSCRPAFICLIALVIPSVWSCHK